MPSEWLDINCVLFFECNCFHGNAEFCCTWIMSVKPSSHLWEVCISLVADLYSGYTLLLLQLFYKQIIKKKQKQKNTGSGLDSQSITFGFVSVIFSGAVLHYISPRSSECLLYISHNRKKGHKRYLPAITGHHSGCF